MALFEIHNDGLVPVAASTFAAVNMRERDDMQRLLRANIGMLDGADADGEPSLMVLAEEYGQWDGAARRIDLLCLDRDANLVVVEIKRTEDGGHMELQALRYAAMVSAMTFERAVEAHRDFLKTTGDDSDAEGGDEDSAEADILNFLGWDEPDEDAFGNDVAIVLVSAGFSTEITTCVLWLGERGIDIRCIRLTPHQHGEKVLLDVRQIVPLPEAADYQIKFREKATAKRKGRAKSAGYTTYDMTLDGQTKEWLSKRALMFATVSACIENGATPESIDDAIPVNESYWLSIEGQHDQQSFEDAMTSMLDSSGEPHRTSRWFTENDQLFHLDGKTWALWFHWTTWAPDVARTLAARHLGDRCTITESGGG
jgi:hypothetical protein